MFAKEGADIAISYLDEDKDAEVPGMELEISRPLCAMAAESE